jgi:hypothetical protein
VKEVKHTVVNSLVAGPQLVDIVAEEIGFRSSKLVAELFQPFEPGQALLKSLCRKLFEPTMGTFSGSSW